MLYISSETVPSAPLLLSDAPNNTAPAGSTVTFTVREPIADANYEWMNNGAAIQGETGPSVSFTVYGTSQTGGYVANAKSRARIGTGSFSEWSSIGILMNSRF